MVFVTDYGTTYRTPHIAIVSYLIAALKTGGNYSYTLKKLMTSYQRKLCYTADKIGHIPSSAIVSS